MSSTRPFATTLTAGVAAALALTAAVSIGATSATATSGHTRAATHQSVKGLAVTGLDAAGTALVSLRTARPDRAGAPVKITGLMGDGHLIGIDYRASDGKLVGVGDKGGLYTVDPGSGAATSFGRLTVPLEGTAFGVDVNPVANAIRIVSDTGQNLRQPMATPGAATVADGRLTTPVTPPVPGTTSGVSAVAYTNNDASPSTGTVLYDLNTAANTLVIQSPANAGTLSTVGMLTVDPATEAGFDIYTSLSGATATAATGFATLSVGGQRSLFTVDLTTGAAHRVGSLPAGVTDIALPLAQR